ncbi:hypothetical protein BU26DRAFT_607657 [Trematosphaeria pertusa]|uniref:Uncharacterized protein n=1 Tax=Trematosphaeria pertusa TaxID=390896 RepID=A0A6A6I4X3_9PLEO|nr:uncharacterized protein BU26DRAFT_607657 [Trematosphaeria pertusa]KAF2245401.1 hypothetical protein BU26DRAFT_607657 [Trematosphaeria pertusa]
MFLRKALALVGLLATGSLAAVAGLKSRQTEPSNFKLYAYGGDEVGGYEIFYADGLAYIGNSSALTTATEATAVNFTASSDGVWTATPASNVSWTSQTFFVSNTTGEIGFVDSTNSSSDIITSGFMFYGKFALLTVRDHMEAAWNAKKTDVEDVWSLGWGSVDEDSTVKPIVLRSEAPMQKPANATS